MKFLVLYRYFSEMQIENTTQVSLWDKYEDAEKEFIRIRDEITEYEGIPNDDWTVEDYNIQCGQNYRSCDFYCKNDCRKYELDIIKIYLNKRSFSID